MTRWFTEQEVAKLIEAAVAPLHAEIARLEAKVASLQAKVDQLETENARLKKNSSSSSKPPSSDIVKPPPPPLPGGKRKRRRRGGQPPPSGALLPTPVGHLPEALGRKADQEFADQRLDLRRTFRRAALAPVVKIDPDLKRQRSLQRRPPKIHLGERQPGVGTIAFQIQAVPLTHGKRMRAGRVTVTVIRRQSARKPWY